MMTKSRGPRRAPPAATTAAAAPTATATATQAAAAAATEAAPAGPDYVAQALADGAPFPYGYDEPEGAPKSGGILRISLLYRGTPATFDTGKQLEHAAATATFSANRLVGFATGQDLGKYVPKTQPELAKNWEIRRDGLEFTFELEPNINFQNVAPVNGRPFTAQDVKLSYDRHAAGGLNQAFFAYADSFAVVDDQTFSIQMSSPDADLPWRSPAASYRSTRLSCGTTGRSTRWPSGQAPRYSRTWRRKRS